MKKPNTRPVYKPLPTGFECGVGLDDRSLSESFTPIEQILIDHGASGMTLDDEGDDLKLEMPRRDAPRA